MASIRYPGKKSLGLRAEEKRAGSAVPTRRALSTICGAPFRRQRRRATRSWTSSAARLLGLPQENLLYFLEKTAPRLQPWQREILRIVRHIAQYFYPQSQTKVMNEGTATYVHYRIMKPAARAGPHDRRHFLEFLQSHTNVVFQPEFDDPRFRASIPMRWDLR